MQKAVPNLIAVYIQLLTKSGVRGASVDPTLPVDEHTANNDCLTFVGNNSDT